MLRMLIIPGGRGGGGGGAQMVYWEPLRDINKLGTGFIYILRTSRGQYCKLPEINPGSVPCYVYNIICIKSVSI